jgi:hypothetical protein
MKHFTLIVLLVFLFGGPGFAQAVFQSNGGGNWSNPGSWSLISGSSSTNYPVAGDTATITATNTLTVDVNSQCSQLTVNGGSTLLLNSTTSILTISNGLIVSAVSAVDLSLGALTVTGTMSVGGASTVTVNQGVLTVVGIMSVTSPASPAGTTLLDVEGGVFSCAGGMTITATTVPAGRFAELRIGSSAVNLAGGLITVSANARINFTGPGALTLAGVISIPNTGSFIAGNGRVVYFGIPGSNQTVAPLTYYRLVITGLGTGIKEINGAVVVIDTLTLLTDTLVVNPVGSLTLDNAVTVVRTGGILLSAPVFTGVADVVYNDIQRDTTGLEMPASSAVLRNLTINDIAGIKLGSNVTVNNNLSLLQGPLVTDIYSLDITNAAGGTGTDPGVSRNNGYVIGSISRSVGTTTGLRIFPLGTGTLQAYRELDINYTTAPTAAGILTVQDLDSSASNQSGLPLTDNGETIVNIAPMYWQADATGGLTGGDYTLTLTAGGAPGVSDLNTLRIVKRPSTGGPWILDGTAGTNSGTTSAPVIVRSGMSGFSQFSFGSDGTNTLPIVLLSFAGNAAGSNVILNWTTSSEINNLYFTVEHGVDGQHFSDIATLPGSGTTVLEHAYTFTQVNAPVGANYYRLKQTDASGSYTYSAIIVCTVAGTNLFTVFPNPATSIIIIQAASASSSGSASASGSNSSLAAGSASGVNTGILLFNANGQYIRPLSVGTNNVSQLPVGIYYIKSWGAILRLEKL